MYIYLFKMRALVTGSTGFIGSYVVQKILKDTDWTVVGLERLSFSGDQNRLTKHERYVSVHHNLQSAIPESVAERIGQVDYIIHIAASSHVDRSIEDPMTFVLDNVVGTCNILNFARTQKSLKKFLYFSTDEVFGPCEESNEPFDEYDRYNSTNPYSATKAGGEELAVAFRNTYKIPISVTHTMNVFGKSQHPEKFIPMCFSKIENGETIQIHADSSKSKAGSRFYIHGDDVADAVLFVLALDDFKETVCPKYNIVGEREMNNYDLAFLISKIVDKPLKYEFVDFHSSRPGHDLRYAISGKKLAALGWLPKLSLESRLSELKK